MSKLNVVGAVADGTTITLYDIEGEEHSFEATKHRLNVVVEKIVPTLQAKGVVVFDTSDFEKNRDLPAVTGLFTRVKLAWESVKDWAGYSRRRSETEVRDAKIVAGLTEKVERAGDGYTYGVKRDTERDHLVAVVDDVKVPGVEKLSRHLKHALATKNPTGVENFLVRVSKVIEERGHSMEELMTFLHRTDLPLCDDGSILAYKRLYRAGGQYYVDCHTRSIRQRVGSVVEQDRVDPNRRTECSTGFHIGRVDYRFSGDVGVLTKIGPEDVIAVPINEPSKMRVQRYWNVAELPQGGFEFYARGKSPLSDKKTEELVSRILKGDHDSPLEWVRKVEGEVITTPMTNSEREAFRAGVRTTAAKAKVENLEDYDDEKPAPPVKDPARALNEAAQKAPQTPKGKKAKTPAKKVEPKLSDLPESHQKAVRAMRSVLKGGGTVNKTKVAKSFNISARTVGRLMEKWCNQ